MYHVEFEVDIGQKTEPLCPHSPTPSYIKNFRIRYHNSTAYITYIIDKHNLTMVINWLQGYLDSKGIKMLSFTVTLL